MDNDIKSIVSGKKIVSIRYDDVVEDIKTILNHGDKTKNGGPVHFTAVFVDLAEKAGKLFLVSCNGAQEKNFKKGDIEARVFRNKSRFLGIIGNKFIEAIIIFKILYFLIKKRPDCIFCVRRYYMLWPSYLASKILSIPLIYCLHNRIIGDKGIFKRLLSIIDHFLVRRSSIIICHGPFLHQQLIQLGVESFRIIEFDTGCHIPADESVRSDEIQDFTAGQSHRVILYLGRIETDKGVFDLLEACTPRILKDQALRLVFIGSGDQIEHLRTRVACLGLSPSQVYILGLIPWWQIGIYIKQSFVLVAPSRSSFPEGRCMSAMESLAMGVPVIVPDYGPFPFLVRHGENGLLYTADSINDLQKQLETLLDDPILYERIREGAGRTGIELIEPIVNFAQAVNRALRLVFNL